MKLKRKGKSKIKNLKKINISKSMKAKCKVFIYCQLKTKLLSLIYGKNNSNYQ